MSVCETQTLSVVIQWVAECDFSQRTVQYVAAYWLAESREIALDNLDLARVQCSTVRSSQRPSGSTSFGKA